VWSEGRNYWEKERKEKLTQPDSSSWAITRFLSRETLTLLYAIARIHETYTHVPEALSVSSEVDEVGRSHSYARLAVSAIETSGFGNPLMWETLASATYNGSFTSANCASMSDELMWLINRIYRSVSSLFRCVKMPSFGNHCCYCAAVYSPFLSSPDPVNQLHFSRLIKAKEKKYI